MLEVDEREEPITLSEEATAVLERLFRDTEKRFRTDLAEITDWAGKYVGAVLRIAGLLHAAQHTSINAKRPSHCVNAITELTRHLI